MRALRSIVIAAAATLLFAVSGFAQSQATSADLTGTVADPNGAVVAGATVTARGAGTGVVRTATSGADGSFQMIGLPPGDYEVTAESANFKKSVLTGIKLTVGQSAELTIRLEVGETSAVVNVTGDDVELVETSRTNVSNTIEQVRINNLPINERSATGFALTISTVGRDNGRPIGPAPTSGLNIGGQRGRSTLVQVDGADFTDNSINAARSTVSQEAVQEYQVTTNSYMPEFGRATGGIVNVVTRRGTEEFSGNLFGFIRHKSIQARNALAPIIDNDPSKKPPYTRAQYGGTLGGPMTEAKKTFFFFSLEKRNRQESGFFTGDIFQGGTESLEIGAPFLPGTQLFTNLTPAQKAYIQSALASGDPAQVQRGVGYAFLASAGGQTSLNGRSTLVNLLPGLGVPQGQLIGPRFILSGAPVPLTRNSNGQFVAFRPLSQLSRVFPISEDTTFSSLRVDHAITDFHQLSVRFGYNPSEITGIQDESQNQTFGQNDYSRTGIQELEDFSFGTSLTSVFSGGMVNELYYNFGRRVATFDSQIPSVAHQISGSTFMGSNPFSPVDRVEKRHQIRNNFTTVWGNHTFKFGGDLNWISGQAEFELNFPALFNFGAQSLGPFVSVGGVNCDSTALIAAGLARCPAITPVQAYGLGFPAAFIQGFGNPNSTLSNKPIAVFGQDTWKVTRRFTLNYGVRYDYEFTTQFPTVGFRDPLSGITLSASDVQTAQDALNVTQGIPRDGNNIAPRIGFAWDITGDGKTLIRAAVGRFFDHPLLAVSFNSNIADASQQQQLTLLAAGGPSPTALLNAFQVFHGTVCNRGTATSPFCAAALAPAPPGTRTPGIATSAEYLFGFQRFNPSTFTGFGPILPFTLHVDKDFQYPDAVQGNFTIERQIGRDMSISAGYVMVNAKHLGHPSDANPVNQSALVENFRRFVGVAPPSLAAAAFGISIPSAVTDPRVVACPPGVPAPLCFTNLGATWAALVPGFVAAPVANLGSRVISPIAANYFRRLGPNYFFVQSLTGLNKATFDMVLPGTLRSPGPINSYHSVNAQVSDGNSSYNAMNLELKKRFSTNMQFLASYTWSHSIDDSSDLQTLLLPQTIDNMRGERSDSLFDQRHRFVFSGVMAAPDSWRNRGGIYGFMHGFTLAPIVEFASGRPFNILAVGDANGDFNSSNERPSVRADGTLCQTGVDPNCSTGIFPSTPNLPRNYGITHNYFSVDARLTRRINLSERISLDLIAEGFNLFNRFNEAGANPFYQTVNQFNQKKGNRYYSQPTAAFDPRQFQFGAKILF